MHLVEALWMMAADVNQPSQRDTFRMVCDVLEDKIVKVNDLVLSGIDRVHAIEANRQELAK